MQIPTIRIWTPACSGPEDPSSVDVIHSSAWVADPCISSEEKRPPRVYDARRL